VSEPPYPYGPNPEPPYRGPPSPYPGAGPEPPPRWPDEQPPQGAYQGPWQYAQGPYPYPPYGAYGGAREHPQGTTILVLGIVSLAGALLCGFLLLLGPVAWIMGNTALAEIDQNPMAYSNRGNVQGGRICGIIATVLLVLGVLFIMAIFAAAG
jgi:hypothetical protein